MKPPKRKQPTWRTPAALSAFVLLAWAWDTWLGHGGASPVGWLVALALVGGISSLAVHSAKLHPLAADADEYQDEYHGRPDPQPSAAADEPWEIRVAEPDDHRHFADIERAADTLFSVAGYGPLPDNAYDGDDEARAGAALLLVAGRPPVAYLWIDLLDGEPHIEELAVVPRAMKKGIGTALIDRACDWARALGHESVTLTTYADVPWNGPWYARRGFVELAEDELTPALVKVRAGEVAKGLDRVGRRIVMRKSLDPAAVPAPSETIDG